MRFEGTRKSKKDKEYTIYIFSFGREELLLMEGLCQKSRRYLPTGISSMPLNGRLMNMIKRFNEALNLNGN